MRTLLLALAVLACHAVYPVGSSKPKQHPTPSFVDILDEARSLSEWIVARRRHLHTIPELFFQEKKTSAYIKKELDALKIKHETFADTGIRAFIGAKKGLLKGEPATIALRADMDALPINGGHGGGMARRCWHLRLCRSIVHAAARAGPGP